MTGPQNLKNHVRCDPAYHFFATPILMANIVVAMAWLILHRQDHVWLGLWYIAVSVALFALSASVRSYPLVLQDRIIRLEERLRLASLLTPQELEMVQPLATEQLIALRFASDAELPALALRAVKENLTGKEIKRSIVEWRSDTKRV